MYEHPGHRGLFTARRIRELSLFLCLIFTLYLPPYMEML